MKYLVLFSIAGLVLASAAEGAVSISENILEVRIGEDPEDIANGNFTVVPDDDPAVELAVGTVGVHYSEISLAYTESGGATELRHNISQIRPAGGTVTVGGGEAVSTASIDTSMMFSVDTDSIFSVTGDFTVTGSSGAVFYSAAIYDEDDNVVYQSTQSITNGGSALGETYSIGGAAGTSTLITPVSYTLNADEDYRFEWLAVTSSTFGNISGASATGFVTLGLTAIEQSVGAVPEPASMALWAVIGGVGVVGQRRRRRRSESGHQVDGHPETGSGGHGV